MQPGRLHNGSALLFGAGDCPFNLEPIQTSTNTCEKVIGCDVGHQKVGRCSTRGVSWGTYIIVASSKVNKSEPIPALKCRGDVTKNPKQVYPQPQNRTWICVHQFLKKRKTNK